MSDKVKIKLYQASEEYTANKNQNLSEVLDAKNSPVLFGCRTGICGTCLVRIHQGHEKISMKSEDEIECLEIVTEDERDRLACQLQCFGDIEIEYIGKK